MKTNFERATKNYLIRLLKKLFFMGNFIYQNEEIFFKILQAQKEGKMFKDLVKELDITRETLKKCLRYFNHSDSWPRKNILDHTYFEKIDTEEKAYWAGFILADGSIYNNTLSVELSIKDVSHLYKLNKALNSSYIVNENSKPNRPNKICRLKLYSNKWVFQDNFMYPNKTHRLIIPKMNKELERHFYRGFFDGDGWISIGERDGYFRQDIGVASLDENFIMGLKNTTENLFGNNSSICKRKTTSGKDHYQWMVSSKKGVADILCWMYENSNVYLDRKYEKYKQIK